MKTLVLMLFCGVFTISTSAAKKEYKFGKVSVEELEQTVCPIDSTADAMYIYHSMSSYMTERAGDIKLITDYKARIKVLTEDGKDEANIVVSYYYDPVHSSDADRITGISANVYNLENGKVVTTKFDKSYVSEEQTSDHIRTTKIALPNVKVGSVIEYKFSINSFRYYSLPTWYAQRDIPVMTCHCDVTIPEYFNFHKNVSGANRLNYEEKSTASTFFGENISNKREIYDGENIPGVKNEKYVYAANSYVSSVNFELRSIEIPGQLYKNYSSDWGNVREQVLGDSDFARYLRADNPFKEEMDALLKPNDKTLVKATKIYNLLKQKVKWNEKYAFIGENPKSAVKEGKGSNAQLNFLFMAMLRDANIRCTPLLIKYRNNGPLPLTRATIDELNTFVVALCDEQYSIFFADGSADFGGINVIPTNLLGEGILLEPQNVHGEIASYRLYETGGSSQNITNFVNIDPSGKISGTHTTQHRGFSAQDYKTSFHEAAGDTTAFLKKYEEHYGIEVKGFRYSNRNCTETLSFSSDCDVAGDEIYVNALGLAEEHNNPFLSEKRQLPVMFPYPQTISVTSTIVIPDGYEVSSLPEGKTINTSDGNLAAVFSCSNDGTKVQTKYAVELSNPLIPVTKYADLREFWTNLLDMNNQMIVLKKK